MEFTESHEIVGYAPVFEAGLLLAGRANPADVRRGSRARASAALGSPARRGVYVLVAPC
ncbi:MAG: hypothetical protein GX620_02720 [Chloroflexi bacterium]|nr:hypothetical protein [Chloroflexota bacterium]